ncbi:MAG TPA: adenylate/guanylate cyclase domain-containing protein [Myxococcaceae bacterium]|nr:adenylate/guanylate cyclase domain-containing protein [Myxococcaceae bacterium]
MKTANLAIVFTDIKGFTERTSRQTLEENERLLKTHDNLLRPLFAAFNGRIVKSIGDAFMVTFESPTQAVLSGIAIQDKLWYHNRAVPPELRLEVRVAINVGEVRLEGNDVFGEPVNIASRVEGVAEVGEVYFTEAVHLAMNKAEVPSEQVGSFELKGIPDKVRIYRVPRAPYQVESKPAPDPHAQPPFGNLGLAKATETETASQVVSKLGTRASDLGTKAARLGGEWMERAASAVAHGHARPTPGAIRWVAISCGALAVLAGAAAMLGRSKVDRAIDAVASASEEERSARESDARSLIAKEPKVDASYDTGRLEQALGNPRSAVSHYRAAAKDKHGGAQRKLIELLRDDECRVREAAATALGELKIAKARSALERLSEKGGEGDDDIPLIGCNSKRAAATALHRLE